MSCSLSPYFQSLTWHVCQLNLQNTYSTHAREHPLSIFDAIFKFAAKSLSAPAPLILFHPLTPLNAYVEKDHTYTLELVFPHAKPKDITCFLSEVYVWLNAPQRHFKIESCSSIECKSISTVLENFYTKNSFLTHQELCLNFSTPIPYISPDKKRKRYITTEQLITMCLQRIERLYGAMPQEEYTFYLDIAKKCTCLPWGWKYKEFHHKAKSTQGIKYIHGFMGPLWLQGELSPLLPVILFCQDIHLGRRLHSGQGAFQLHRQLPFADTLLQRPSLWHQATKKLFPNHVQEDYTNIITCVHTYAENNTIDLPSRQLLILREVLAQIILKSLRHGYPSILQQVEACQDLTNINSDESLINSLFPLADTKTRILFSKVTTTHKNDTLQKIITAWAKAHL